MSDKKKFGIWFDGKLKRSIDWTELFWSTYNIPIPRGTKKLWISCGFGGIGFDPSTSSAKRLEKVSFRIEKHGSQFFLTNSSAGHEIV